MHTIRAEASDVEIDREAGEYRFDFEILEYDHPPETTDEEKVAFARAVVAYVDEIVATDLQLS